MFQNYKFFCRTRILIWSPKMFLKIHKNSEVIVTIRPPPLQSQAYYHQELFDPNMFLDRKKRQKERNPLGKKQKQHKKKPETKTTLLMLIYVSPIFFLFLVFPSFSLLSLIMPLSPLSYGALSFNPFIIFMHCLLISIMFVAKCETLKDKINSNIKYQVQGKPKLSQNLKQTPIIKDKLFKIR